MAISNRKAQQIDPAIATELAVEGSDRDPTAVSIDRFGRFKVVFDARRSGSGSPVTW